jgi:hypothetical protein
VFVQNLVLQKNVECGGEVRIAPSSKRLINFRWWSELGITPTFGLLPPAKSVSLLSALLCITNGNARGSLKVVIAGALIGGLVPANILHAIGADIHLCEASHNILCYHYLYYWERMLSINFEESLFNPTHNVFKIQ